MTLVADDLGSFSRDDDPGEPTTGVPRVSVTAEEAELLAFFARDLIVVEIGTGLGVSTCALARTAKKVITIDPDPWVRDNVAPSLPANVTPVHSALAADVHADLVFIDGDHAQEALRRDLAWARRTRCWYIVCHDCNYPNVADVLDRDASRWVKVGTAHGLAIAIGPWT